MTLVNSTADESAWRESDLQAFWEGLNGIESEPVFNVDEQPLTSEILSEGCGHVKARLLKLRRDYQWIANDFCPKCGEKL